MINSYSSTNSDGNFVKIGLLDFEIVIWQESLKNK